MNSATTACLTWYLPTFMLLAKTPDLPSGKDLPLTEILDQLEEIFFVFTPDGTILQWNEAVRTVTGYTDEEVAAMHPFELVPEDEIPLIARKIERVVETGRVRFEAHLRTRDGRTIPYEFTGSLLDHDGQSLICGTGRDISARRESEKRYRALVETATDGIVIADSDGRIIAWNGGAATIFGYAAEEVIDEPVEILMPERHCTAHREGMRRVNRTGSGKFLGQTLELDGVRKNGDEFPLELSLSSWQAGDERFFASIIRDISARKTMEQTLRESEEKFRLLSERSLVGIAMLRRGRYVYVNPAFARIFGYAPEELTGASPDQLIHPDDWPAVQERLRQRLEGTIQEAHYEARAITKDGLERTVEIRGMGITYRGEPAVIGTVRDITDRRTMEREILEIQGAERRRIARELHDGIASQLMGIEMLTRSLARRTQDDETIRPADIEELEAPIRDVHEQARQLSRGLHSLDLESRDFPRALERLAAKYDRQYEPTCSAQVDETIPNLDCCTATHLYRIAQEAVTNAVRHAEATSVQIRCHHGASEMKLSIIDDGTGPPDADGTEDGLGIRSMRYRADLIGGRLEISEASAGGTRLVCSVPDT